MSAEPPKSKIHALFGYNDEGALWADFGEGIAVKVRPYKSAFVQEYQRGIHRPYVEMIKRGPLPATIVLELLERIVAGGVIEDWRGVTDREGNSLAATDANKLAIIRELPEFRDEILGVSFNATE